MMRCDQCKWWDTKNCPQEEGIGSCRKLPPIVKVDDYTNEYWHWPITCSGDWCADYSSKPAMGTFDKLWSVRTRKGLRRLGIHCFEDLEQVTEVDLLGTIGFGTTSLREVKLKLYDRGLQLKIVGEYHETQES